MARQILFLRDKRFIAAIMLISGAGLFLLSYRDALNTTGLAHLDQPILQWMMAHRNPLLTIFMHVITNILAPVTLGIGVLIGAGLWAKRHHDLWPPALLVGAITTAYITSALIKNLTARNRPPYTDAILPFEMAHSFPSGHVIAIATCLFVLGYLFYVRQPGLKRMVQWGAVAFMAILLVAFSRLYLAYHWVTDVCASIGLALMIVALVIFIDTLRRHTTSPKSNT